MEFLLSAGETGADTSITNKDQLRIETDNNHLYGDTKIEGLSNLSGVYMKYTDNEDGTYTYSKSVYYTWAIGADRQWQHLLNFSECLFIFT